jgi:PucR C-terminal helix-turn-helix domain
MPSLQDLWQAVLPAARSIDAEGALSRPSSATQGADREVGWVRVLRSRVPAFDALEPDDLAILPETVLAALTSGGAVEPASLVDAVAQAGAAGILLVGDGEPSSAATEAAARAVRSGLPALYAVGEVVEIERAVIDHLHEARSEVERRAALIEAELQRLALAGAGLEAQAAAVAAFLDRAVAIEGAGGEALAVHAPPGSPVAESDAARYLAHRQAAALRIRLADAGSLVLLGEAPPSEPERAVASRVAGLLALLVGQAAAPRGGARRAEPLPTGGPPWVLLMARQLVPGASSSLAEREASRERLRRFAPARRLGLRGDATSLEVRIALAPEPADPLGLAFARRVVDLLGRTVAVSRPFADPDRRALAEAEARATLEAFEALGDGAVVARADRVDVYRLLGNLHKLPGGLELAEGLLAPLRTGSALAQAQRLATLRAVLDGPGMAEAAAALGIHRNTLAYRLRRIEALTGWRLDEPDLRFVLAMALRLVQAAR